MSAVAVLPRILGALFYYPPASEASYNAMSQLEELPQLLDWQQPKVIETALDQLHKAQLSELDYPYSILFEGQGDMPAPPWGSVYLDKDNLLMAESTLEYRDFLKAQNIEMDTELNEAPDQFGLMVLVMAHFMETENDDAVIELLSRHLMPWAPRYLEQVTAADDSNFYAPLATIALEFLNEAVAAYEVNVLPAQLYR